MAMLLRGPTLSPIAISETNAQEKLVLLAEAGRLSQVKSIRSLRS